ncbi:MAG: cytochrome b N-terminal domain-containing protein [Chloroflexi bacterium]|nr:cytochrome b N-terminal domain-containing protein [Chloroflexota bacterium]MCI0578742.1 cytochrome b N-terminal domain-containing protein [Chloroflexota bacterium]MCI0643973.1 cytochrome b N-terminal domain-containing protein [Chloroflexota bacterium]MCI0732028.1 cytochrome b N-terminal domain-containing protein [Chloroflexota bacterium]
MATDVDQVKGIVPRFMGFLNRMFVEGTFIEQAREMGLKQATIAKLDESVERLTAGMNIGDVRAALRGDEPRRPNPRLRPHADGFWFHIRPSFYHTEVTHIYPTFRLGWLSTFLFVWETVTGIFLMIFYTPRPGVAYSDIWNMLTNVPLGQLMRELHRLGAEVMVLIVALHMLRTFITGSYKYPRQFTWFTGMLLLVFTLVLSFSGYLLPWDQLSYWAVTVAVSAAEAAPPADIVGKNVNLLVRGAPTFGPGGLLRWYLLHVLVLPLLLGIFFFVHYYKVVLHGHSLPPGREEIGEDTAKRVPQTERTYFTPDILTSELMWTALATLILVAGSLWFYSAPLERQANPLVTPLHVVAPWYLAWSQGWLKLADKVFIAFIFIPALATAFFVMPYFEVGKSRRYANRRIGLSVSMFFIAFMLVSNWMGSPEYRVESSPEQEVSQELIPQEGPSRILEVPYEDLVEGTYNPGQEVEGNIHLTLALEEFEAAMNRHSCNVTGDRWAEDCRTEELESGVRYYNSFTAEAMPDPVATLIIEQEQHNLKRVTLHFEAADLENPGELLVDFDRVAYRHAESNYEEE